ncbi:MAG TPA: hypothetical protein VN223_07270 [Candidatus Elarobacter sp.]|nr:hypothetical protein [Candidatus Elarobacter sp.]
MSEKNRSAAITVIAVLALIGSALLLGLAVLMAIVMLVIPTPVPNNAQLPPMFFKVFRVVIPFIYALPAVWGIVTAVGLLQLKNWARISTIVFSVLLVVFGAFGMLTSMVFFLKPPAGNGLDPKMFSLIGAVMAVLALVQMGIGIWWMIFFNRAAVKAQFVPRYLQSPGSISGEAPYRMDMPYSATLPPPGMASGPAIVAPGRTPRPLSITIIAWFLLVTCLFIPMNLFLHSPVILFVTILTGWRAVMFVLGVGLVNVYVGTALLRMHPAARLIGIGYFIFGLLNAGVFYFAPGGRARITKLLEFQQSMFPWMPSQANSPFQVDIMPFLIVGAIVGLALCLVPIYFLATAKPAFDRAARAQVG